MEALLRKKLELITQMCDLTRSADLGGPRASENYISLINKREVLLSQLKDTDLKLSVLGAAEGCEVLTAQIKEKIQEALNLEEDLSQHVSAMLSNIKKHLKDVKAGRQVSRVYHTDMFSLMGSSYNLHK
jgi:hypothetical protein